MVLNPKLPSPQPTSHPTCGPDPVKIELGLDRYGPAYEVGYWDAFNDGVLMGRYIESLAHKHVRKGFKPRTAEKKKTPRGK